MRNDKSMRAKMGRMKMLNRSGGRIAAASLLALALAWAAPAPLGAQTAVVGRILVDGNQRVDAATIRSYMKVQEGSPADPVSVNESVRALYDTGLFSDVRVEPVGSDLRVVVAENPVINEVAFEGNRRLNDEALAGVVQSQARRVFTRARAEADAAALLEAYRRSGRHAATVEPKIIQLDQNRVNLVFEINEGDRAEVRGIDFVGNQAFSSGRLRDVVATRETAWWRFFSTVDFYDADRMEYDRELLRRFYLNNGYADVEITAATAEVAPGDDGFYLTYSIVEGPLYRFGAVDVEIGDGVEGVDPALLQGAVLTRTGSWFSADEVEKSVSDMTYRLGENGYAFTRIEPRLDRDPESLTIGVTYVVAEGPKVYVERIDVAGNSRTLDRVIRREFELSEGDAFNAVQLQRSRTNIRALGFFKTVDVTTREGSAPDRVIVTANLEEASTGSLQFGLGFSSSENVSGEIALIERNLLGRGQYLRLRTRLSSTRSLADVSFTEPFFLGRDIAAGFDLYHTEVDNQSSSSYDTRNTGFRPRLSFPVGRYATFSPRYQISRDELRKVPDDASPFIQRDVGKEWTSSLGYSATYDRRNDPLEPTRGFILTAEQDVSGLGGDTRYIRSRASAKGYLPIYRDSIVSSLELEGGAILGFGGYDVKTTDRFFLGGDSFRGFESGGLGPNDRGDGLGGNYFAMARAEVTFPLGLPQEYGVAGGLFADAGTVWDVDKRSFTYQDSSGATQTASVDDGMKLRASVGASLFWSSPFGPIRLNFATPIVKEDYDEPEYFRLTAGTRF